MAEAEGIPHSQRQAAIAETVTNEADLNDAAHYPVGLLRRPCILSVTPRRVSFRKT